MLAAVIGLANLQIYGACIHPFAIWPQPLKQRKQPLLLEDTKYRGLCCQWCRTQSRHILLAFKVFVFVHRMYQPIYKIG